MSVPDPGTDPAAPSAAPSGEIAGEAAGDRDGRDGHDGGDSDGPDLILLTVLTVGVVLALAVGGQVLNPSPPTGTAADVRLGVAAAYLGGLLAFLSPCSVAVVPGFFAYGFEARGELLAHTYVFFLGLALVFVPLGFGASLVGQALRAFQTELILASGVLMIVLGLVVLSHVDLFGRLAPSGVDPSRASTQTGRVFLLGAFFGLATTSCTAPILAGITVLSVGAGLAPVASMALFFVFALGIATPLFALAWAGDRTAFLERLRGGRWQVEILGKQRTLVASKVLTGVALVVLGVVFIATDGTRELLGLYDAIGATELYESLDLWLRQTLAGPIGWVLSAVLVGLVGWAAWRRRHA